MKGDVEEWSRSLLHELLACGRLWFVDIVSSFNNALIPNPKTRSRMNQLNELQKE